eukprot:NODE_13162_length_1181_cov_14.654649.p1 GENE.NODE_13162_length_1181_cov_14.654649~~NODE_13162_length_1181_cov_14.654649.p1  ORF type:complete len:175 (+),score=33.64 NODE_13162_length_1181_cov_14.654649:281-805(+)
MLPRRHHRGQLVLMIWRILINDMVHFTCVTSIFVVGFGLACFVAGTAPQERCVTTFVKHLKHFSCAILFGFESNMEVNGGVTITLLTSYSIIVSLLLLNVLIAMMNDTYNSVKEAAEKEWNLERARIVVSIQRELPHLVLASPYWSEGTNGQLFYRVEHINDSWAEDTGRPTQR